MKPYWVWTIITPHRSEAIELAQKKLEEDHPNCGITITSDMVDSLTPTMWSIGVLNSDIRAGEANWEEAQALKEQEEKKKVWTGTYACKWPATAYALAAGEINRDFGIEVGEGQMEAARVAYGLVRVTVPMTEIMKAQVAKAQVTYVKSIETQVQEFEAREQTEKQRTLHRRQDARVIVQDMVTRAYGRERRTYVAEVELDGARITVTAAGKDLTPKQHVAFKAALARAMQDGIVSE